LSPKEEQRLMQIPQIREVTVSQYKEFFGISEQLARMDLNKFVKLGYMQKLGIGSSAIYIKK
jgi:Fic family protein